MLFVRIAASPSHCIAHLNGCCVITAGIRSHSIRCARSAVVVHYANGGLALSRSSDLFRTGFHRRGRQYRRSPTVLRRAAASSSSRVRVPTKSGLWVHVGSWILRPYRQPLPVDEWILGSARAHWCGVGWAAVQRQELQSRPPALISCHNLSALDVDRL